MSNSTWSKHAGRIVFLFSSLLLVFLCAAALKLEHAHPGSKRVLAAAGYGLVILGVFWTRCLEIRLKEAGLPRWTFWPYFLIVFTGCLGAFGLKFTNTLETLGLFLALQLPALVFSGKPKVAESLPQGAKTQEASAPQASKPRKPARKITPLGTIEFAVYVALIAGLLFVLHLLRGDVTVLGMPRAFRIALDAASILLVAPWIFCVRGRFRSLGLTYWYPAFCSIVLVACFSLFALGVTNFRRALILFAVLQLPAVILQRGFVPSGLVEAEAAEEAGKDS